LPQYYAKFILPSLFFIGHGLSSLWGRNWVFIRNWSEFQPKWLKTLPLFRMLVSFLSPRINEFDYRPKPVRFVAKEVALRHNLLWVCRFLLVISFHHWSTHNFIYVLLLPERQTCDNRKATKQQRPLENRGTFYRKVR